MATADANSPRGAVGGGMVVDSAISMGLPSLGPLDPLDEKEVRAEHVALRRKVRRRTIPWLFALVLLIAMYSRTFGYAALTMKPSLGLSNTEYGVGSSVFYAGYMATQLPAVWLTRKIGAPQTLSCILLLWGTCAALFAMLRQLPQQSAFRAFCVLRVLLGAAEGGLVPSMYCYLTLWFGRLPDKLTGVHGQVTLAAQVASVLGGLVAAPILKLNGIGGLEGWQWLFLLEAAPVLLAAALTPRILARDPQHAPWLDLKEQKMLQSIRLQTGPDGIRQVRTVGAGKGSIRGTPSSKGSSRKQRAEPGVHRGALASERQRAQQAARLDNSTGVRMTLEVLRDRRVVYLALMIFFLQLTLWSLIYWQPLVVQQNVDDASQSTVVLLAAVPYACGVVATFFLGKHASSSIGCCQHGRRSVYHAQSIERRWHSAIPMLVGSLTLFLSVLVQAANKQLFALSFLLLCVANCGLWSVGGLLSTWPSEWLSNELAAVALAVTSIASALGGLVGPAVFGVLARGLEGREDDVLDLGSGGDDGYLDSLADTDDGGGAPGWKSDRLAAAMLALCALVAAGMAAGFQPVKHDVRQSRSLGEFAQTGGMVLGEDIDAEKKQARVIVHD